MSLKEEAYPPSSIKIEKFLRFILIDNQEVLVKQPLLEEDYLKHMKI